jgi:hypothetical protein
VVIPVVYTYLDDFGLKVSSLVKRWTSAPEERETEPAAAD